MWAFDQWQTMCYAAWVGDECARHGSFDMYEVSKLFFENLALVTACEPCRMYYTHHLQGILQHHAFCQDELESKHPSLLNFVHAMRCFVQAKINGAAGKTQPMSSGNVMQLRKRLMIVGTRHISTHSMLHMLMIQCVQAHNVATPHSDDQHIRSLSIAHMLSCLILLMQYDRPHEAKVFKTRLCQCLKIDRMDVSQPRVLFSVLCALCGIVKDPVHDHKRVDEVWVEMQRAFTTGVRWWAPQTTKPHPDRKTERTRPHAHAHTSSPKRPTHRYNTRLTAVDTSAVATPTHGKATFPVQTTRSSCRTSDPVTVVRKTTL